MDARVGRVSAKHECESDSDSDHPGVPAGSPAKAQFNPTASLAVKASPASREAKALEAAWLQRKAEIFAGNQKPDSEDPDIVTHYNW